MKNYEYDITEKVFSTASKQDLIDEENNRLDSNRNINFYEDQEERCEHFDEIEEGEFYPVDEIHQEIIEIFEKNRSI
ncbi:MAG: hypothetical protein LBD59_00505 [Prevotellaceae bacterium]|jgi:hypothetical protein|nr:hypothetical protein [Prevotellaceae bacterium]